ncbi:hypothetical protein TNCV_2371221 [Trichonephila clavipes]|nr:hypothetical protein TNCV_2371221 [Trichonephila clavipes]
MRHGERLLNSCVIYRYIGPAPGIMIENFPWSSCSPYLSPIKKVWSMPASELVWDTPPAATADQLWQYGEAPWIAVLEGFIQNLFDSMLRRVAVVIANNGGYTNC